MNVTSAPTFQPAGGIEVIPGYVLREKLGAGGFGEVWRADAPGGLSKAVKFVFGLADDTRARREMEALERIKELRHPFLLSTERVEVVRGTLVIVLELAEGNLRERLDECLQQGLRGLPADELISQLRDAADALDYLWTTQSLQHLDVKPENLMLSGGRVKVGDFGLLKQVDDDLTTLGGVTPAYAAPEVFDGRPAGKSDQYSLAIVYQELLTGQLPFRGRTAAQLAMQHAHHPPVVDPLPFEQRAVVKRALSKQADERFPSCRAFVDALIAAQKERPRFTSRNRAANSQRIRSFIEREGNESEATSQVSHASPATERLAENDSQPHTQVISGDSTSPDGTSSAVAAQRVFQSAGLAPLPVSMDGPECHRPALVIGLGGVGTEVVSQLKRAMTEQLGQGFDPDIHQFLAIDTSEESIRDAAAGMCGAPLDGARETLRVPLKMSHEYRDGGIQRFNTMDRRWVYNVPRSLRTERMRPFGRLAFVDHYQRIQMVVDACLNQLGNRAPSKSQPVAIPPAIFIVGSICGATCGGMANELGYLLRNRLRETSLREVDIVGVFTSELPRDENLADLSAANGMAFLAELEAYANRVDGYRGEPAAGIPGSGRQISPFDQTMFLHLGADSEHAEKQEIIRDLRGFLLLNLLSPSCHYFAKSYHAEAAGHVPAMHCRTFARASSGMACLVSPEVKGRLLAHEMIKRWIGYEAHEAKLAEENRREIQNWTSKSLDRLGQSSRELADWVGEQFLARLGISQKKLISRSTRRAVQQALAMSLQSPGREMIERMLQEIDLAFGEQMVAADGTGSAEVLAEFCHPLIDKATHQFEEWVKTLVDTVGVRFRGASLAVDECDKLLDKASVETGDRLTQLKQRIGSCRDSIFTELVLLNNQVKQQEPAEEVEADANDQDTQENPLVRLSQQLEQYALYRFNEWCARIAEGLIENAVDRLTPVRLWLERLHDKLARLEKRLTIRNTFSDHKGPQETESSLTELSPSVAANLEQLLSQIDEAVALESESSRMSLVSLADAEGAELNTTEHQIDQVAQHVLKTFEAEPASDDRLDQVTDVGDQLDGVQRAVRRILPPDSHRGEAHRLMVLSPGASNASHLETRVAEMSGAPPTLLAHPALNVEFMGESLNVDPANLAKQLYQNKERRLELAERLRTRIDL